MMNRNAFRNGLLIFALTFAGLKLVHFYLRHYGVAFPFQTFTAIVLLVISYSLIGKIERLQKNPLSFAPVSKGAIIAILYCLPVFLLYSAARILWPLLAYSRFPYLHWSPELLLVFPVQMMIVSIPEELFFRGMLFHFFRPQDRMPASFNDHLFNRSVILTAVLFALAHFILTPDPVRLATFFPGVFFGFLRSKSGSLTAPVIAHALANTIVFIFEGKV